MQNVLISACLLGKRCRYDGKSKPMDDTRIRLLQEHCHLIPICPEIDGGLPTPRVPSEIQGGRKVVRKDGVDVTAEYEKGAEEALRFAKLFNCKLAILKERSPSCGNGAVYDGTFTGTLTKADGKTAELLKKHGITVIGESQIDAYFAT